MAETSRDHQGQRSVTVATAVANSDAIYKEQFAGGSIVIPSGSSITTLTFYGAQIASDTFVPLIDDDGANITKTVKASAIRGFPTECFAIPILKLVGNAAGTVTVTTIG